MQATWHSHRGYPTSEYVTVSLRDDNTPIILCFFPRDLPALREAVRLLEQIEAEQPPADKAVA